MSVTNPPARGDGEAPAPAPAPVTVDDGLELIDAGDEDLREAIADHVERGLLEEPASDLPARIPRELTPLILRSRLRILKAGCYALTFTPNPSRSPFVLPRIWYQGTMRVETFGGARASGDLYRTGLFALPIEHRILAGSDAVSTIPSYPRHAYRYHLRVTSLPWLTFGSSLTISFERHLFSHSTGAWTNQGTFTATMSWTTAPTGSPDPNQYLSGTVKDAAGVAVGTMTMGWVSTRLRKATVEIDRVAQSEAPLSNAAGTETWATIGAKCGWDIHAYESDTELSEPSGESWSDAELHQQLLTSRDSHDLDSGWRYVILAVRRLDSTTRGIMFDAFATDSNNVPREGAALASHWTIPNSTSWGTTAGSRFGAAMDPYFRTAVHELGHAFNLIHNESEGISGTTFMSTTPTVVAAGTSSNPFPGNITWDFHATNKHRLRHWPDVYVRPGGRPFASAHSTTPIVSDELVEYAESMTVAVRPLLAHTPLGAPVRLEVVLRNDSEGPVEAPADLRFEHGHVTGRVVGPGGESHPFRSLVRCLDDEETVELEPGGIRTGSLTLLRGPDGALFGAPGVYTVEVDVDWTTLMSGPVRASGRASVFIDAPEGDASNEAAAVALAEPDLHVVVALGGGDHLVGGLQALDAAMADDMLRPHYAVTEAKHAGRAFFDRPASADGLADAVDAHMVATADELRELGAIVEDADDLDDDARGDAKAALRGAADAHPLTDVMPDLLSDLDG